MCTHHVHTHIVLAFFLMGMFLCDFIWSETHYISQAGFELTIFLYQSPKCCDYKPPQPPFPFIFNQHMMCWILLWHFLTKCVIVFLLLSSPNSPCPQSFLYLPIPCLLICPMCPLPHPILPSHLTLLFEFLNGFFLPFLPSFYLVTCFFGCIFICWLIDDWLIEGLIP